MKLLLHPRLLTNNGERLKLMTSFKVIKYVNVRGRESIISKAMINIMCVYNQRSYLVYVRIIMEIAREWKVITDMQWEFWPETIVNIDCSNTYLRYTKISRWTIVATWKLLSSYLQGRRLLPNLIFFNRVETNRDIKE